MIDSFTARHTADHFLVMDHPPSDAVYIYSRQWVDGWERRLLALARDANDRRARRLTFSLGLWNGMVHSP